ncbi:MAG TPA: toll/interleukin-1 receptor domain-containing protein [Armatimonadota bacterium]|nr:toll/interleukin-1 receptor domain-containing protein [Armatimonadota bacterium]
MHPYRVFLSYSREDQELVDKIVAILEDERLGLVPRFDRDLRLGNPFAEGIKSLIETSHVFVPVLTANSKDRPWVHQEIGYAMGWGVPILPIAIDVDPGQMIQGLQAIKVDEELYGLLENLVKRQSDIDRAVMEAGSKAQGRFECAVYPETRTQLIAEYAERVRQLASHCRIRQRGAFSSFSLPREHFSDPVWLKRDYPKPRSEHYRMLQWCERMALEEHAVNAGCDLLIDPSVPYDKKGQQARNVRLETLVRFLESMPESLVRVATTEAARRENTLIVGDWFYCQSMAPKPGVGYYQTIFTWHAPRVLLEMRQFDQMFLNYYVEDGRSRDRAINAIEEVIGTSVPSTASAPSVGPNAD